MKSNNNKKPQPTKTNIINPHKPMQKVIKAMNVQPTVPRSNGVTIPVPPKRKDEKDINVKRIEDAYEKWEGIVENADHILDLQRLQNFADTEPLHAYANPAGIAKDLINRVQNGELTNGFCNIIVDYYNQSYVPTKLGTDGTNKFIGRNVHAILRTPFIQACNMLGLNPNKYMESSEITRGGSRVSLLWIKADLCRLFMDYLIGPGNWEVTYKHFYAANGSSVETYCHVWIYDGTHAVTNSTIKSIWGATVTPLNIDNAAHAQEAILLRHALSLNFAFFGTRNRSPTSKNILQQMNYIYEARNEIVDKSDIFNELIGRKSVPVKEIQQNEDMAINKYIEGPQFKEIKEPTYKDTDLSNINKNIDNVPTFVPPPKGVTIVNELNENYKHVRVMDSSNKEEEKTDTSKKDEELVITPLNISEEESVQINENTNNNQDNIEDLIDGIWD